MYKKKVYTILMVVTKYKETLSTRETVFEGVFEDLSLLTLTPILLARILLNNCAFISCSLGGMVKIDVSGIQQGSHITALHPPIDEAPPSPPPPHSRDLPEIFQLLSSSRLQATTPLYCSESACTLPSIPL